MSATLPVLPHRGRRQAFTVVELLVAMVVLTLILAMFLQITGHVSSAYLRGVGNRDNYALGRALLDSISRDLQAGVFRTDLPTFPLRGDGRAFAFYTATPGIAGAASASDVRNLSYVEYAQAGAADEAEFQRRDAAILWNEPDLIRLGDGGTAPATTERTLATGVLDFDYRFIARDATVSASPAELEDIVAVRFSVAVANERSMETLRKRNLLEAMKADLGEAVATDATLSAKALWEELADSPTFLQKYPAAAVQGIRFFERTLPLHVDSDGRRGS